MHDYVLLVSDDDPIHQSTLGNAVQSMEVALTLCRLMAVRFRTFPIDEYTTINEGFYYLYRFKTQLPHFQYAWECACSGGNGFHNHPAFLQLDGLSRRLHFLFKAQDECCVAALLPPDNDTADTALYHFGYMIILAAGISDDLAWCAKQIHSLNLGPRSISLPRFNALQRKVVHKKFLNEVRARNPALFYFLACGSTRATLSLLHAIRDTIVHRRFIHSYLSSSLGDDDANRFVLEPEVVRFVRILTKNDPASWGMKTDHSVELLHFIMRLTPTLVKVFDRILALIPWTEAFPAAKGVNLERFAVETFRRTFARELNWRNAPEHF